MSYETAPRWIREIPEHFKMSLMCNEAVAQSSYALGYAPDYLKTQEKCKEAVSNNQQHFFLSLTVLKHQKCISKPLK